MLVIATLFLGSNAVLATNSNSELVSIPEIEIQTPTANNPDFRIDVLSEENPDGSTIILVRTRWYLNGTLVKDEFEIIVVGKR